MLIKNLVKKLTQIDGRWFLTGSHILLLFICMITYNLQRSYTQILFSFFCAVSAETILYLITNKYKTNLFDRLFSAIAEWAGLLILIKSTKWWFYGLLVIIAISSKYFLRRNQQAHIFNPTNFAIILCICLFPIEWFGVWPDEYMISLYPMIHVFVFGLFAIILARSWFITLSYFIGILFSLLLFFKMNDVSSLTYALGPELGTVSLIFMFLMITDPKTSPRSYKLQFIYGFGIAFIHIYLRQQELFYSRFISIFIMTLIYYVYTNIWLQKRNLTAI